MKFKVIGTGSKGNCYILDDGCQALIIEAGTRPDEVKQYLNYDIDRIAGVLCSHGHDDHIKFIDKYLGIGIECYASKETVESKGIISPLFNPVKAGVAFNAGKFKILPFEVKHDVPCLGFLINHPASGNILFVTDTHYIKYKFPNLNHAIVECNYDEEILEDNLINDRLPALLADRITGSHMSVGTVCNLVSANDSNRLKNVILLHMSEGNCDPNIAEKRVKESTMSDPNVVTAVKGLEVDLNINPF